MSDEIALLSGATKALADVSSAKDAWEVARTAEAARRYAQLRGLGHRAVNYATGIKAKAMILLADFVDAGQADGTVATKGKPPVTQDNGSAAPILIPDLIPDASPDMARLAVREARRLRDTLTGQDIDALVEQANDAGEDFGIRGLRRAAAATRDTRPVAEPIAPKSGTYSCMVIDPPWPMPKIERDERPNQGQVLDYPTMTVQQLADEEWLPVRTMAADDCHVYLWVTHKFLPVGLSLLEAWGFNLCHRWLAKGQRWCGQQPIGTWPVGPLCSEHAPSSTAYRTGVA